MAKPAGYWQDLETVKRELLAFIAQYGQPGVMPEEREFARHGCSSLGYALTLHGGLGAVAARLGLRLSSSAKPRGYWDDFENVAREVLAYSAESGQMPTYRALLNIRRSKYSFFKDHLFMRVNQRTNHRRKGVLFEDPSVHRNTGKKIVKISAH